MCPAGKKALYRKSLAEESKAFDFERMSISTLNI